MQNQKRKYMWILIVLGGLFGVPQIATGESVAKTFSYYADLFEDGETVGVQLQYHAKFGDHYKIIAYSPDRVTIQNNSYAVLIPERYNQKDNYLEIIFDAGFVTPKISLFPPSSYIPQVAYILLGALFIAVVSRVRFNRWTPKNEGKYAFPPRSFTTWPRFIRSALLYVVVIESIYFTIIYFPGTVIFVDKYLGGGYINYDIFKEMGQYSVLWSIFLLSGVLPNFPWISRWESSLRDMLQGYAFIPSEAKAVVSQLKINHTAFKPDDKIIDRVLPRIGAHTFSQENFLQTGDAIEHRWCKLSYLKYRLVDWMTFPRIDKFFALSKKNYDQFIAEYKRLKSEIDDYFGYVDNNGTAGKEKENANGLLSATKTKLNKDLDACLNKAYDFICIGILGTEKMPGGRKKAFNFFGLAPFIPERSKIDWDTNLKTIGMLVSTVFFPTLFYYLASDNGLISADMASGVKYFPKSAYEALYWSMIAIAMHALTIILVIYFDRWRARVLTSEYDEEKSGEPSMPNRLSNNVLAALIGFSVGFAIMGGASMARNPGDLSAMVQLFLDRWVGNTLWSLLPATTGFFIQYYLNTYTRQNRKGWRLGLQQGLIMSAMVTVVSIVVIDRGFFEMRYFILYAAMTCFLVGAGIGYVFPQNYLKKIKKPDLSENRRRQLRANVMEPATVYVNGSRFACNIVDLSEEGAKIDRKFRFPGGSQVEIDAVHLGKLNSMIVRKEKKGTIVKFPYLDQATQRQINAYLDRYAS